ncbi:MAG: dihydroorotase [Firmicutes bacterium HGW-Firmicutes-14]|nr:MAG: dihydroorotase [Firmicutes bacterium HGW-Firmicutes-14]
MKLLIKGGRVVDPAAGINGENDILVEDGKISAVGNNLSVSGTAGGAETIDAAGKLVLPGLIDMHVHLREPGFEAKETIATGTRAAAMGGFTGVACMPNTNPVIDSRALVEFINSRAASEGLVNVYPIGAVTKGSKGEELAEIGDMKLAGAVGISDDGHPVMNAQLMRLAMEYAGMFGLPVISHCEDLNLVADGVMHEGYQSTVYGLKGITRAAEETMVARDIILAELTGARLHIAHISTAGSVDLVRMAKKRGLNITAEATPHHFSLTDEAVGNYDTATKVNPPLRGEEDVEAVREGLRDGTIDVIATDHAPHAVEEKDVEFNYAPFGIVGLETAVGLSFRELVEPGILTVEDLVMKMSVNPARILGLVKGTLKPGADADITIIDPDLKEKVDISRFETKGKNSPFGGWELKGLPVATIVGGRVVMRDRRLWQENDKIRNTSGG